MEPVGKKINLSSMKKFFIFCLVSLFIGNVFSQEEKKAQEGTPSEAIAAIRLASDLVKYGYANNEALPLIQAAEILLSTPTQESKAKQTDPSKKTADVTEKTTGIPHTPEALLADAKELAQGSESLLALIKEVEGNLGQASRGRVGGPGKTFTRVYGGATDTYEIQVYGGELFEIAVSGDGDTDLDLYVYGAKGKLIGTDDDYSDDCYLRLYPELSGYYVVKVVNRGRVYNDYVLVTN
ncbi:hypothetical protein EZS27_015727 [termite gut metagenome]|uniref:Peptidase C-terminal archaeal/bacterial domain-containing protein n=1 Tax=termite gut metagenome TaxID=433724 RepID=A0A5J4RSI8_9ZZZZ